jgi:uncharacterized tellurite resistance protein B-like protein
MLSFLSRILGLQGTGGAGQEGARRDRGASSRDDAVSGPDGETVRRIARALDRLEPERARHVAAFAFILSRVAHADSDISEAETREMERKVMTHARLPEAQAALVVEIAKHQNILFGGTDNFVVTREFSRHYNQEQKADLLHCLFAISAADQSISTREEATIEQISRELGVAHKEMVRIRAVYRDKRAVLKNLPR